MATKDNRAAQARAQAQKQVASKERRTTVIVIAVSLAVIAAFAGIVYFIVQSSAVPTMADVHKPAGSDLSGGIPVGASGVAGEAVDPDTVRVDVYVDFLCPYCRQFEEINAADLAELREAGDITVFYHPIAILDRYSAGTKYPSRAANAAGVVADQAPEAFVAFTDAMFANQPDENTPGLDDATIAAIAVAAGVPEDVAAEFADGEFAKWVIAATNQASLDGFTRTPSIVVNGELLDGNEVNYMTPGVLRAHLEQLADA